MKEKPILFSTPMVQALLNTKPNTWPAEPIDPSKPYKWMTRRVIKPQPDDNGLHDHTHFPMSLDSDLEGWWGTVAETGESRQYHPYQIGDHLWVRETWQITGYSNEYGYEIDFDFKAGGNGKYNIDIDDEEMWERYADEEENLHGGKFDVIKWRPSIFMPRAAARIFLEVKDVRVEWVQDITERDAVAEGVSPFPLMMLKQLPVSLICPGGAYGKGYLPEKSYKAGFYKLWEEINSRRGYPWESNPYVYVYRFMRVT